METGKYLNIWIFLGGHWQCSRKIKPCQMFSVRPLSPFTLNPLSCWVIRLNSMFLTVWPQEVLSFVTAGGGECARRKWVVGGWKSSALKGREKEEAEWRRWKEEKQRMSNILASRSLTNVRRSLRYLIRRLSNKITWLLIKKRPRAVNIQW